MGYGEVIILNLFAFRATLPPDMLAADDPIGPDNDKWIAEILNELKVMGGDVICAWGTDGGHMGRDVAVVPMIYAARHQPQILKLTKHGHPGHPLYIGFSTKPRPWHEAIKDIK